MALGWESSDYGAGVIADFSQRGIMAATFSIGGSRSIPNSIGEPAIYSGSVYWADKTEIESRAAGGANSGQGSQGTVGRGSIGDEAATIGQSLSASGMTEVTSNSQAGPNSQAGSGSPSTNLMSIDPTKVEGTQSQSYAQGGSTSGQNGSAVSNGYTGSQDSFATMVSATKTQSNSQGGATQTRSNS